MESAEPSSHDPIDATDKVPSSWFPDTEIDAGAAPAAAPTVIADAPQRRPIPSILRRETLAPTTSRVERAPVARVPAPELPVAKPLARVNVQKVERNVSSPSPVSVRASVLGPQASSEWLGPTFDERPTMLWGPRSTVESSAPAEANVELAPPFVETVPVTVEPPVEPAVEPSVVLNEQSLYAEQAAISAPSVLHAADPAATSAPSELHAADPAATSAPSALDAADDQVVSPPGATKRTAKRHRRGRRVPTTKRQQPRETVNREQPRETVRRDAAVDASPTPRTFGAGMLDAHKVRPKVVMRELEPPSASLAFGAGMLEARQGRNKRRAMHAQATFDGVATAPAGAGATAAMPTFGVGMLRAQNSPAKWLALALAVAAIAIAFLATR